MITLYAVALNTPVDKPTEAITISRAPRALRPAPSAVAARGVWPARRAPTNDPANLATMATSTTRPAQSSASRSASKVRSTRIPAAAKNTGARKRMGDQFDVVQHLGLLKA